MRNKKLAYGSAAAAVAALLVTNPFVAEAARTITSADIANKTIKAKDIEPQGVKGWNVANGTLRGKDVANDNLKSWDIADGTLLSKDVKDGSLTRDDFAAGTLPVSAYTVVAGGNNPAHDPNRSKNVKGVSRTADGIYCIELDASVNRTVPVVASPLAGTNTGTSTAQPAGNCGTNGVEVRTAKFAMSSGEIVSSAANDVSFTVLVP